MYGSYAELFWIFLSARSQSEESYVGLPLSALINNNYSNICRSKRLAMVFHAVAGIWWISTIDPFLAIACEFSYGFGANPIENDAFLQRISSSFRMDSITLWPIRCHRHAKAPHVDDLCQLASVKVDFVGIKWKIWFMKRIEAMPFSRRLHYQNHSFVGNMTNGNWLYSNLRGYIEFFFAAASSYCSIFSALHQHSKSSE